MRDRVKRAGPITIGVALLILAGGVMCACTSPELKSSSSDGASPGYNFPRGPRLGDNNGLWQKMLICLAVLVVLFGVNNLVKEMDAERESRVDGSTPEVTERGALAWVNAFTKRDFAVCDLLIDNQNSRLYAPLVLTHAKDRRYYDRVLNGVVDSIVDVGLIEIDEGDYKFRVRLKVYEPVGELELEEVRKLWGSFIDGTMADHTFSDELGQVYYRAFSSECFNLSEEETDIMVTLREGVVDGSMYVSGTTDFVDIVYEVSGLAENVEAYETRIKPEVDSVLKSGFDN